MIKRLSISLVLAALAFSGIAWWQSSVPVSQLSGPVEDKPRLQIDAYDSRQLRALPAADDQPPAKVELGRALFHDKRLSHDDSISCASCHDLARAGVDNLPVAVGINGRQGSVNTPTVFNSRFNFRQFWDGRAASLEAQAPGPVHNPLEMASSWQEVIGKLSADRQIKQQFRQLYPDGITADNIADAIASFEKTLVTTGSRFDQYLDGNHSALSEEEIRGYQLFRDYGCISCHQGINLGGNMFQRFGIVGDYFAGREIKPSDLGRYNVTGLEEDRFVFKVPSLRNVALTAPYLHDGQIDKLESVVVIMGKHQLGRTLDDQDVSLITAFLKTLSGQIPQVAGQ